MNRFRTKKRGKDDAPAIGRPSTDTIDQSLSMPSFKSFRRAKKSQEEEKEDIDISSALPSSDDFRTSLLMTGLSARFSMLREQDDPHTKIGKASDDSVLFPKRQSRLDLGLGLADIAEVESIRAPPSFARMDSYTSDDADSLKGSIMARAKPTEGNNLFGGRQKIYKIPVGSAMDLAGGMGGRALYGDDVALSAFQRWRQAEKQRRSLDGEDEKEDGDRSESPPPLGYNRKRETSSTTSSAPSLARNSTAATSVTSQPTPSVKDWQSQAQSAAPTPTGSTPAAERSVARTRRLYEQSLNQDLYDQQSSAVSRIDTLSRQRALGSRTPESAQPSPAPPTTQVFNDRFSDRRSILTKASAPNLRSISPAASGSSLNTMDMVAIGPRLPETAKPGFAAGTPPLSPPISEASEHLAMAIQPNDLGKATALGVFQKPAQPYDESKYAELQLQLQQGRDAPAVVTRADSRPSLDTERSRSSSAQGKGPKIDLTVNTGRPSKDEAVPPQPAATFLSDDSDESPVTKDCHTIPPLVLQRPLDEEHPALRVTNQSPTNSPPSEKPEPNDDTSRQVSPEDSPTLGPTSGLSGMVRQHLRSESGASSIYGAAPPTAGLDSKFSMHSRDSDMLDGVSPGSNPWDEPDWAAATLEAHNAAANAQAGANDPMYPSAPSSTRDSDELNKEDEDDFAHQLANARRRVQERLTSYAESDTSRAGSPQFPPEPLNQPPPPPPAAAVPPVPRNNALGIMKTKSVASRDNPQSKAIQMLGPGGGPAADQGPADSKASTDEGRGSRPQTGVAEQQDADEKEESAAHPGLRAFRNARRELQRRKELETMARHQNKASGDDEDSQTSPGGGQVAPAPAARQRSPSTDRRPPPVSYRQRAPSQDAPHPPMRSGSRPPSSSAERERSGSEASNGRSYSRPPMMRNNSSQHDEHSGQLGVGGPARQTMSRLPRMVPPPAGSSPGLQPGRSPYIDGPSGAPSPVSPFNESVGFPSPMSGTASPVRSGRASTLDPSLKRVVSKHEISDPTFVMSTSRVPTVSLPQSPDLIGSGDRRSRSTSRSRAASSAGYGAPPLPPINPRRRREDSKPRASVLGGIMGGGSSRRSDGSSSDGSGNSGELTLPATRFTGTYDGPTRGGADEQRKPSPPELLEGSRWVRAAVSEANEMHAREGVAPPRVPSSGGPRAEFFATGPPATRTVITANNKGGPPPRSQGMPGGMI